jgi:hypothetical protein
MQDWDGTEHDAQHPSVIANACLIVLAVNMHAELVTALENLLSSSRDDEDRAVREAEDVLLNTERLALKLRRAVQAKRG